MGLRISLVAALLVSTPAAAQLSLSPASVPSAAAPARSAPRSFQEAIERQVRGLETRIDGRIGVSGRLLETGESFAANGGEAFPMASTVKVAIAGTALSRIDRGELTLEQMVTITPRQVLETAEPANRLIHPGVSLSLANLIELMLTQSNNNATDRVLELAGGPAAVTAWLRASGIQGQRVDRSVNALLNDFFGFPAGSAANDEFYRRWKKEDEALAASYTPRAAFDADPKDSSTPQAMTDLLAKLLAGDLLSDGSRRFLIGVMERCETGADRLKGLLPEGTVVAHKTGSLGGTINDVGMITLPGGRGHLVLAVYTKNSPVLPVGRRERVIAEVARAAYDYFGMR